MDCHLQHKAEFSSADDLAFETIERFVESDHLDVYLCKCIACSQLYLACYIEWRMEDDDDSWNFYAPVEPEEVDAVRKRPRKAFAIIKKRKHITWHPSGRIYWSEHPEIVLEIV